MLKQARANTTTEHKTGAQNCSVFCVWSSTLFLKSGIGSQKVLDSCHRLSESGQDCAAPDLWERWARGKAKEMAFSAEPMDGDSEL